jgi:lambda repressor-like predicted transcriptional regulator
MIAAAECVREIFPQSSIKTVRTDSYPNRVTITTDAFGLKAHEVWSGKQSNLFQKFKKRRRKVMDMIKSNLADLREGETIKSTLADP